MEKLTRQEEELLMVIYQVGSGFIKDFLDTMPEPRPPYTTLASTAKNLERKGFLTSKQYRNSYAYSPVYELSEFKSRFMTNVVQNYFENSYKEMVSFMIEKQKISPKDLQDIIELIEKGKQ
jgi:BlaI family penicillinase repressor